MTPQVYVTNAADGSVTVLDQKATSVQATLQVGGRPVGVVRTVDGRLWVADADSGNVTAFDATTGDKLDSMQIGPKLTALSATPDGHYLVLASSDPDTALYTVDLVGSLVGGDTSTTLRHLGVPGGVLALATGAEISRAYATTADGNLLYWDLESNTIAQTIPVGHKPMGLALGIVEPAGGSTPPGAGTTSGGASGGAAGGTGTAGAAVGGGGTSAAGATGGAGTTGASTTSSGGAASTTSGASGAPASSSAGATTGGGATAPTPPVRRG